MATRTHATQEIYPGMETLSLRTWKGRQSVELEAVLRYPVRAGEREHRLKVCVDRDSYDFQSSASVYRWTGEEWRGVASIPYPHMATVTKDVYYGDLAKAEPVLLEDARELARLATLVLS